MLALLLLDFAHFVVLLLFGIYFLRTERNPIRLILFSCFHSQNAIDSLLSHWDDTRIKWWEIIKKWINLTYEKWWHLLITIEIFVSFGLRIHILKLSGERGKEQYSTVETVRLSWARKAIDLVNLAATFLSTFTKSCPRMDCYCTIDCSIQARVSR